jgi:hypothetical protein
MCWRQKQNQEHKKLFFFERKNGYVHKLLEWCMHFAIKFGSIHQFPKGNPSREGMGLHPIIWI